MSSYKKCCTLNRGHRKLTCIADENDKFVWIWCVVIYVQHQIVASIPVTAYVFSFQVLICLKCY